MSVFRYLVVAMIAGVAGSTSTTAAAPKVAAVAPVKEQPQHEAEPRVEIGPAVLYIFDEHGKVIAVE
jgi:hypothetical protein